MLDKFKNMGWKKFYLIYAMCTALKMLMWQAAVMVCQSWLQLLWQFFFTNGKGRCLFLSQAERYVICCLCSWCGRFCWLDAEVDERLLEVQNSWGNVKNWISGRLKCKWKSKTAAKKVANWTLEQIKGWWRSKTAARKWQIGHWDREKASLGKFIVYVKKKNEGIWIVRD